MPATHVIPLGRETLHGHFSIDLPPVLTVDPGDSNIAVAITVHDDRLTVDFEKYRFELVIHAAAQPSHDWAAREPVTDFTITAPAVVRNLETNANIGRPISYRPVPPGTPRWGAAWKKATAKWYQHAARITLSGSNYANRYNYIDLDPTYKDQLGRPLLRMTYNFVENDYKVGDYCMRIALDIARAMQPTMIGPPGLRRGD